MLQLPHSSRARHRGGLKPRPAATAASLEHNEAETLPERVVVADLLDCHRPFHRDRQRRYHGGSMGITYVQVEVANVALPERREALDFLVDSGATYSVVPSAVLARLEIQPLSEQVFRLANGERISRKKGGALFRYGERVGVADVVFGEEGDAVLLGALTLESLGLALHPLRRELIDLPLLLV